MKKVVKIYDANHQICGEPKIAHILQQVGNIISERIVEIYMKENGKLEASYLSSTTRLVMCVMPTEIMHFDSRIKNCTFKRCISLILTAFSAFMVIGRLISGVHWFSDIIGGALLSS